MDLPTLEKDFDTAFADAQAAMPAVQTVLTLLTPFFPQAKIISTGLGLVIAAAPDVVAAAKKLEADFAPLLALLTPAATTTPAT